MRPAICELTITSLPVTIPVSGISFPLGVVVRYTTTEMAKSTPTKTKNFEIFMVFMPRAQQARAQADLVYGRNLAASSDSGSRVFIRGSSSAGFSLRDLVLAGPNPAG